MRSVSVTNPDTGETIKLTLVSGVNVIHLVDSTGSLCGEIDLYQDYSLAGSDVCRACNAKSDEMIKPAMFSVERRERDLVINRETFCADDLPCLNDLVQGRYYNFPETFLDSERYTRARIAYKDSDRRFCPTESFMAHIGIVGHMLGGKA